MKNKGKNNLRIAIYIILGFLVYSTLMFEVVFPAFNFSGQIDKIYETKRFRHWYISLIIIFVSLIPAMYVALKNDTKETFLMSRMIANWLVEIPVVSLVGFSLLSLSFSISINTITKAIIPAAMTAIFIIWTAWDVNSMKKGARVEKIINNKFNSSQRLISFSILMYFVIYLVLVTTGIDAKGTIPPVPPIEQFDFLPDFDEIVITIKYAWAFMIFLAIYFAGVFIIKTRHYFGVWFKKYNRSVVVSWVDDALTSISVSMTFYFMLLIFLENIFGVDTSYKNRKIIFNSVGIGIFVISFISNVAFKLSLFRLIYRIPVLKEVYSEEAINEKVSDFEAGLAYKVYKSFKSGKFNKEDLRNDKE